LVKHPDTVSDEKEKQIEKLNEHLVECQKELKLLKRDTEQMTKISRQESKIELLEEKNRELLTA
jgi:hypothetical protein